MRALWCLLLFALLTPFAADAGELTIRNTSSGPTVCHADGYPSWALMVQPGETVHIEPSYQRKAPLIDWAECGGLRTRAMNITPQSPDGLILFTGAQKRVLNVALYPDIPSHPNGNFAGLLDHVVNIFQASNPDVLLNVVMADEDAIYSFDDSGLPRLLGPAGYDVLEVDAINLGFLVSKDLITPAKITGDPPWPAAQAASTIKGVLYGIPSWLCMDFVFSFSSAMKSVHGLSALLRFEGSAPKSRPALLADYDGSWRLPSIYINAYVQTYGYQNISKALAMPPDRAVISNLKALVTTCEFQTVNSCIDGTNHGAPDGTIERLFATGNAGSDMGFSEQSFYIVLNQTVPGNVTVIPAPWGERRNPLLYADTFVTNKSTCAANPCQSDSAAFTSVMTSANMKSYIAFSQDLSSDMPPRHLLVATQPFWNLPSVAADPIYQQVFPVVQRGKAFPNEITPAKRQEMDVAICTALQAEIPGYNCKR